MDKLPRQFLPALEQVRKPSLMKRGLTLTLMSLLLGCTDGQLVTYQNSGGGSNNPTALFALGQPNMYSLLANNGGVTASSMSGPGGVATDGTHFFVADSANNRVLVWNSIPSSTAQPANVVLGQATFAGVTANYGGLSGSSLSAPLGVYATATQLFVADSGNHRVLVFTSPYTTFMTSSVVLGQSNSTSATVYGPQIYSFSTPTAISGDGTYIFVSDSAFNRILVFATAVSTFENATYVLGQTAFTTSTTGISATALNSPAGIFAYNGQLLVADQNNNRVVAYNSAYSIGEAASFVFGQNNLTNNLYGTTATTLRNPQGVFADLNHTMIIDSPNNRVVEFNPPYSFGMSAAYVYGQYSLYNGSSGSPSPQTISMPNAGCANNGIVYLSDPGNNRVLAFPER